MKAKELRSLTLEELNQKLISLKTELFSLSESRYTAKLEKPHKISQARKEISRILTILNERENDEKEKKDIAR